MDTVSPEEKGLWRANDQARRAHETEDYARGFGRTIAAEARAEQAAASANNIEFREEVLEALCAEGKARHVAANLTNTELKLRAEARRLGVI